MKKINHVIRLKLNCLLIIMSLYGCSNAQNFPAAGSIVDDFRLKNIDGKEFSLQQMPDAKGFIIVFICTHCPCVAKYEDRIIALDKKYKPLGYPVIAINSMSPTQYPTETLQRMKLRAELKKYSFPYLRDETQKVALAYGARVTPYAMVIQKNNLQQLVIKYTGLIDDNMWEAQKVTHKYIENAVNQLIQNVPVETTHTKPLGCSINLIEAQN